MQGARLTAYELQKVGVDVTLICDNMASTVMRKGGYRLSWSVATGSRQMAIRLIRSGLREWRSWLVITVFLFYVLGPTSTIDLNCPDGDSIVIEERNPKEITDMWYASRMAPEGVKAYNPAF